MNACPTPTPFFPTFTADREHHPNSATPAERPAFPEPALPRSDASEPADLSVVVVRGYN